MDREAWHAAVHRVAKSWRQLSNWTELNFTVNMLSFFLFSFQFFLFITTLYISKFLLIVIIHTCNYFNTFFILHVILHCLPQYLNLSRSLNILFFSFIFISWRLITLQYCSGFCHTLTWISHGFTCVPHPDPPSHLSLYTIPLGLPSAPGPNTCLMHPTWAVVDHLIFLKNIILLLLAWYNFFNHSPLFMGYFLFWKFC